MSFDLQKMFESKRAHRQHLAARPIGEKLRMLDALRERELAIRGRAPHAEATILREPPAPYRTKPE
jgi:chorismate-pyruvate lyase